MEIEEIAARVPQDWLQQHWEEYLELCEKHTVTIIMTKAFERRYQKPLKTPEQFEDFFQFEAKSQNLTPQQVKNFLNSAGQLKARATIFEQHFKDKLPHDQEGNCLVSVQKIRKFIDNSFKTTTES